MDFIKELTKKRVAPFLTPGAYPNSVYAFDCIKNIKALLKENNNEVIAHYHCQGTVDPKLIEWMPRITSWSCTRSR